MKTEVLHVHRKRPAPEAIARAAAVLRAGGLVAFPTETVYGLGGNALDPEAVSRIFAAKGRPGRNPVIVHLADANAAADLTTIWPEAAARLADHFWPGPLTLVVQKSERVPAIVTAGGATVALRVPSHPVALLLLNEAGIPVAAPSANRSAQISPTRAEHVLRDLDGQIDLLLDAGPTAGGLESTVLDLTSSPPRLLRPGLVTPTEIEAVIGPIVRPETLANILEETPLRSPGMLGRHYAPRAVLECVSKYDRERVEDLCGQGLRVGWLTFSRTELPDQARLVAITMPSAAAEYAARFYAALHTLDAAGVERIVVALPPATEEWLAVHDRLRRASVT